MSTVEMIFSGLMALKPEHDHWRVGIFHDAPDHNLSISVIRIVSGEGPTLVPFYPPTDDLDIELKVQNQEVVFSAAALPLLFQLDGPYGHNRALRKLPEPKLRVQPFRTFAGEFTAGPEYDVCFQHHGTSKTMKVCGQICARVELKPRGSAVLSCDQEKIPMDYEEKTDYMVIVRNLPTRLEGLDLHDSHHNHGSHFRLYYRYWDVAESEQYDVFPESMCPETSASQPAIKAEDRQTFTYMVGTPSRPCIPTLITASEM
jgi:hypothetical protein